MNTKITSLFLFFSILIFSQKKYTGVILDKQTLKPIEFAAIFNSIDYTITNEEGIFDFITTKDSITFNCLGYKTLKKVITELPKDSLIYLIPKTFQLDEVVVSDKNSTLKKMISCIDKNFSQQSYNEEFFLRAIVKRNDSIIKIQDLNGIVNRKSLFPTKENPKLKKNYTVYIKNMRKAGYTNEAVYVELWGFNSLLTNLTRINFSPDKFIFKKNKLKDSSLNKLEFTTKSKDSNRRGYYLLNSIDYSIHKAFLIDRTKRKFIEKNNVKFRTTKQAITVTFLKDIKTHKYRIDHAKNNLTVELIDHNQKHITYELTYIYKTSKTYDENTSLRNKISVKKDIFKIKHPYHKEYWKNNQQLKLTKEMVSFLNTLENTNFKTVTNLKK